jgi:cytochrome c553
MTKLLRFLAPAALIGAVLGMPLEALAQTDASRSDPAVRKIAASVCSACHGPSGISTSPLFPNLAGQNETYLAAQLSAFKARSRAEQDAHDYMWGMAAMVDDSAIAGLAHYYASQQPARGTPGNPELVARGKLLFENGDPKRSIVACVTCHGKSAEGTATFPRLAGQHAAYITRQLEAIQGDTRASPVMHSVIKGLEPGEIKAIAEYLQAL